ncbi:hypothetical protein TrRE_jg6012, partial [Triparma retinervis]
MKFPSPPLHALTLLLFTPLISLSSSYPTYGTILSSLTSLIENFPTIPTLTIPFCATEYILCVDLGDEGGIQIQTIRVRGFGVEGSAEELISHLQIHNLTLKVLDFGNNELTGPLPTITLSNFPTLAVIDLSSNKLSGEPLPTSGFPSLVNLKASDNSLQGDLSFITPFLSSSIQTISLHNNKFTGRIPPSFAPYLSSNLWVDVVDNSLTGPTSSTSHVCFSTNASSPTICTDNQYPYCPSSTKVVPAPSPSGGSPAADAIYYGDYSCEQCEVGCVNVGINSATCCGMQISTSAPATTPTITPTAQLPTRVPTDMSTNIPTDVPTDSDSLTDSPTAASPILTPTQQPTSGFPHLSVLVLSGNPNLIFPPTWDWVPPTLTKFDISSCNVISPLFPLPPGTSYPLLKTLLFSSNAFSFPLPSAVSLLSTTPNLEVLWFSRNDIRGILPPIPSTLRQLNAAHNNLTGGLNDGVIVGTVEYLDVSDNPNLAADVGDIFKGRGAGDTPRITHFIMKRSSATGTFPASISAFTNLLVISCFSNSITGQFPWSSLTSLPSLVSLSL